MIDIHCCPRKPFPHITAEPHACSHTQGDILGTSHEAQWYFIIQMSGTPPPPTTTTTDTTNSNTNDNSSENRHCRHNDDTNELLSCGANTEKTWSPFEGELQELLAA